jgi:hypothetical protein
LPVAVPYRLGRGPAEMWLFAEPTETLDVGYDVSAKLMADIISTGVALCKFNGEALRCELVALADDARWKVSWQERWERVTRRLAAHLTPRGEPPETPQADARVVPVTLDEVGRLGLKFVDAVRNITEAPLADWDLDGPRTTV